MGRIIGIDLGTTNSLAAYHDHSGPRVVPLPTGDHHLPSAVSLDPVLGLTIGREARESATARPDQTILSVKRHMGTDRVFEFGGEALRPQDVSALILKELRRLVEAHLLAPVDRAVISVPAYFNEVQRRATREAGEIAGLTVERLISEPTAAALAFGIDHLDTEDYLLVYDLGGGTFDVSVLEMFEGVFNVRACDGDCRLGGDDFDARLLEWILGRAKKMIGDREFAPHATTVLRNAVERAKIDLSSHESTNVRLEHVPFVDGTTTSIETDLTRGRFEDLTLDLLERTGACVKRALAAANVTREQIADVLLVGGSTRMPMVSKYLTRLFGKPPLDSVDPMQAVAIGCAIQARLLGSDPDLDDIIVTDISPFTLGVSVVGDYGGTLRSGVFVPLIQRNSSLPATRTEEFSTTHPEQDTVTIEVYQGDDPLVENNVFLDRYFLGGFPTNTGECQALSITFRYDEDGILHVDAVVKSTGKKAGIRIDPSKMKTAGWGIASRSHIEKLWSSSRAARQLREVIARIEASLPKRPEAQRAQLAGRISEARRALEDRDPKRIARLAEELALWVGGE